MDSEFAEEDGYVRYHVNDIVKLHIGRVIKVYSNFQPNEVNVPLGVKVPNEYIFESPDYYRIREVSSM
jgi:hypothetical protein